MLLYLEWMHVLLLKDSGLDKWLFNDLERVCRLLDPLVAIGRWERAHICERRVMAASTSLSGETLQSSILHEILQCKAETRQLISRLCSLVYIKAPWNPLFNLKKEGGLKLLCKLLPWEHSFITERTILPTLLSLLHHRSPFYWPIYRMLQILRQSCS